MKGRPQRLASIGLSALAFAALTALSILIFREFRKGDMLETRNDVERTMNVLLAGLRDHADFGSAIEDSDQLDKKVIGVAAYAESGERLYTWGSTPERLVPASGMRTYEDRAEKDSIAMTFRPFRAGSPRDGPPNAPGRRGPAPPTPLLMRPPTGFLFTTLRQADLVYIEVREPEYWRDRRIQSILFPLIEAALAALILFIRGLQARNAEYRRRIEEQKSLVVLGTAASTLAHEIKNPLLSIRLQTRILEKTSPLGAGRELGIINEEVDRLSALSHRVGDYLRDPAGKPQTMDPAEIALEVGMRLCGRNILRVDETPPQVDMDPERLRSVLENLLRNAIEAGGPEEGLSIEVGADGRSARIDILDRGEGLSAEAASKLFDPFFTTKSRGTGIGLSVCRRFVEAAGGTIRLEHRAGGGCRARLILPAAKASS